MLTVIGLNSIKKGKYYWDCLCDCGNKKSILGYHLINGNIKSCSCINIINLVGQKFGLLTVLGYVYDKQSRAHWKCRCDCGKIVIVRSENLRDGTTKSCGCKGNKIHGMTNTRFFRIWNGIKVRCLNKNSQKYQEYGALGVTLHIPWEEFLNFKEDMYESYLKHVEEFGEKDTSIDRFPNQTGNYEPNNIRWATLEEQNRNRCVVSLSPNYDDHLYWQHKLQSALRNSVKFGYCLKTVEKYLGCTIQEFKVYIESKFIEGMTWENHGKGITKWQFDHIIGCNNFDLSKEDDRFKCFHYTNLRPMWGKDHQNKSTRRIILI